MLGGLCQIEIPVRDLDAAAAFYRAVFGWQPVPAFMHDYLILDTGEEAPYGVSLVAHRHKKPAGSSPSAVLYFRCADAKAVANEALAHGGRIILAEKRLPSYGRITVIADLDGHKFGLFEAVV